MQGISNRGACIRLFHADVHGCHAGGRAVGSRQRAIIAQELDDGGALDQGDSFGVVLDPVDRVGEPRGAESALLVVQGPGQRVGVVCSAIQAVVEDQRVVGEDRTGRSRDFHALVGIGADVVVVDFVDPNVFGRVGIDDLDRNLVGFRPVAVAGDKCDGIGLARLIWRGSEIEGPDAAGRGEGRVGRIGEQRQRDRVAVRRVERAHGELELQPDEGGLVGHVQ